MTLGPGKYDQLCTHVREAVHAAGVLLIVLGGDQGSGFSVQSNTGIPPAALAALLEQVARQVRQEPYQ